MDHFSDAAFSQDRLLSTKIAQFLRGTVIAMMLGGVMYAAALVAHTQERVTVTRPLMPRSDKRTAAKYSSIL